MNLRAKIEALKNPMESIYGEHATVFGRGYEQCRSDVLAVLDEGSGPITEEWLRSIGFLQDGRPENGDIAIRLWSLLETESDGMEPAMQVSYSCRDGSLWLETYGSGGESLCLVELPSPRTRADVLRLLEALNITKGEP